MHKHWTSWTFENILTPFYVVTHSASLSHLQEQALRKTASSPDLDNVIVAPTPRDIRELPVLNNLPATTSHSSHRTTSETSLQRNTASLLNMEGKSASDTSLVDGLKLKTSHTVKVSSATMLDNNSSKSDEALERGIKSAPTSPPLAQAHHASASKSLDFPPFCFCSGTEILHPRTTLFITLSRYCPLIQTTVLYFYGCTL